MKHKKQKNIDKRYIRGIVAEFQTINILKRQKYEILHHRFQHLNGEIDIIAKDNNELVAVEVKHRQTYRTIRCVKIKQRKNIKKTLSYFLEQYHEYKKYSIRFDVVLFAAKYRQYAHLKGAFK